MHNIIDPLKILAVDIDTVKPDPKNLRKHPQRNIEAIKQSLVAYGQRKPIVVNAKTGYIEAGNGLWEAAKALSWNKIAVVYVSDDPVMAKGYAIMDNQSALLAEWDFLALKDVLEELDVDSLKLTGFTEQEVDNLIAQFAVEENMGEPRDSVVSQECPKCGYRW